MSHSLVSETWARLAEVKESDSLWHRVVAWHDGQVELGCRERDSFLTWTMENANLLAVDRVDERPAAHLCIRCRLRDQLASPLFAPEAA
jgi:hypothetical protein